MLTMLTVAGVLAYLAIGARVSWSKMWADFSKLSDDFGDAATLSFVLILFALAWPAFVGLAVGGYALRNVAQRRERKRGWFSESGSLHQSRRVA